MSDWLFWLALAAGLAAVASWGALWSYGRFARLARGRPSHAIPAGRGGALDALVPDGPDGAALSFDPAEALALRLASARLAARSIDVMTYIWYSDATGRQLAAELARAARRGVRVRILLDDVNLWGRDRPWLALDRIEGVEIRLFNPVRQRRRGLARGVEMALLALRYNRRMHGKLWSVDGRLALTGGRNLGDGYFGLAHGQERNQSDADILLTGGQPGGIVARLDAVFDEFWNSGLALPIAALWSGRVSGRLAGARRRQRAVERVGTGPGLPDRAPDPRAALAAALGRCRRGVRLRLIADPPAKALGLRPGPRGGRGWLPDHLAPVLASARRSLTIATPYLVPGRAGLAEMTALAGRGVRVTVLTNSLAVVDHAAVWGAYRWYRTRLMAAGIRLFEFAGPRAGPDDPMLHAKLALIDGETGFVGSFNFDLRSAWLNTEIGVLFDDPALVAELDAWLAAAMGPGRAWAVERHDRRTLWRRGEHRHQGLEPRSPPLRRILAFVVGHLPIHRWL